MPTAAASPSSTEAPSRPRPSWLLPATLVLAVAGLLARDSRGEYIVPSLVVALLQVPLLATWAFHRGHDRRSAIHRNVDRLLAATVAIVGIGMAFRLGSIDAALVAITGFLAGEYLLRLLADAYRRIERAIDTTSRVCRIVASYWVVVVLLAAILLALPVATEPGVPDYRHNFISHVVSNLHTAVSAGCLVGTFTFSFAGDYTTFGQITIVLLTQLCGFGLAAVGLSLVRPVLQRPPSLARVLATAALLEVAGMAVLFTAWRPQDAPTLVDRAWWSLVHSGSALWNTGITLRPDGLAGYFADRRVFLTITTLAITGSLGIPILLELLRRKSADTESESPTRQTLGGIATFDAFAAFVLLFFISVALFYFEHPASIAGEWRPSLPFEPSVNQPAMSDNRTSPWPLAVLVASTCRSAGLQSVPVSIGTLSWPSYGLLLVAMMIGGGIAGTAGGIRTSLFALLAVATALRRDSSIRRNGASIPMRRYLLTRFLFGLGIWIGMNGLGVALLGMTTNAARYDTTFDAIAAMSNVGLTTGLAAHLTVPGRLVAIALMLAGRWWPIWFWARTVSTLASRLHDETAGV